MSFIFRYHIKNKDTRANVDLSNYSEDIIKAIKSFYGNNLKDCRVEKDYYEYKLYINVENGELRAFGRSLVHKCNGLNEIWGKIKKIVQLSL